ncbi:hypothetical protein, partial [Actinomadura luteofluorescens]
GARSLAGDHAAADGLLAEAGALRAAAGAALPPGERRDVERISGRIRDARGVVAINGEASSPGEGKT